MGCQLRSRFIRSGGRLEPAARKRKEQMRENMSQEEEAVFLTPFLEKAAHDGIMVAGEIKRALDAPPWAHVPLSSVYSLSHRHNWRKLAPGKGHPQA